jgi:hypothetical protein
LWQDISQPRFIAPGRSNGKAQSKNLTVKAGFYQNGGSFMQPCPCARRFQCRPDAPIGQQYPQAV